MIKKPMSIFNVPPWFVQPDLANRRYLNRHREKAFFDFFYSTFVLMPFMTLAMGVLVPWSWAFLIASLSTPLDPDLRVISVLGGLGLLLIPLAFTALSALGLKYGLTSAWRCSRVFYIRVIIRLHAYFLGPLPTLLRTTAYRGVFLLVPAMGLVLMGGTCASFALDANRYSEFADSAIVLLLWNSFIVILTFEWCILLAALCIVDLHSLASTIRSFRTHQFKEVTGTEQPDVTIAIAHLSDLHLTATDESLLFGSKNLFKQSKPAGTNAKARMILESWKCEPDDVEVVIISGDAVDTGHPDEWKQFFDLPVPFHKCVLAPGNHDINIAAGEGYGFRDTDDFHYRKLRLIRWIIACDRVQGDRAFVFSEKENALVPFRKLLRTHVQSLESFALSPPKRAWKEVRHKANRVGEWDTTEIVDATCPEDLARLNLPDEIWAQLFPLVVDCKDAGLAAIVIDSNMCSSNVVSNAFGHYGDNQLSRLNSTIRLLGRCPYFIATHHHFGVPRWVRSRREDWKSRALVCIDAIELVDLLLQFQNTVVFCGHRHVTYTGRIAHDRIPNRSVEIVSAPSTTLGDDLQGNLAGFYIHRVAVGNHETSLANSEFASELAK